MKEKTNKPIYKRWWFIALAALMVIGIIGSIVDPVEEDADANEKKVEELKKQIAEEEKEKAAKPKPEPKKEKPKSVVEKLDVDKASLEDGILTLETEATNYWDETGLLKSYVYELFEEMAKGFDDASVEKAHVIITTAMVDNKGNETVEEIADFEYSRVAFEELNYDKFAEMAYSASWRILNEADTYWIHPGIYTKVKDDYRKNLSHGPAKQ